MLRLRIKEVAEARGVNMSQLSRRADLAYGTVSQLWHNPEHDATLSTLSKIAQALGVRVKELIEEDGEYQGADTEGSGAT